MNEILSDENCDLWSAHAGGEGKCKEKGERVGREVRNEPVKSGRAGREVFLILVFVSYLIVTILKLLSPN